ncbi:hypothetical protein G6F55_002968 [Rhizopus delemar]|nr:hypothetical protein G6F55_002968 [Rhizopus delemar]KAG1500212.1 hypothetical protein G6F54_003871 [Rhizopus delemar]KAG1513899.1 hypothetical protein G6F53_004081 [Rhizopus delemar]KAG1556944.1 hypothetical protein G6F49_005840 [Rhizopus delemar]KAG1571839.1 hypothetical protein G6F50_004261 [Rhizopus delemar]
MDDDAIEYYFDDIESFYSDEILNRPYSNEQDVQRIITQYIRFLIRYSKDFLKTLNEINQVAYKLIDSKICLDYSTVVLAHIIHSHALKEQEYIPYAVLLAAGRDEPRWMKFILSESIQSKKNRLFRKLIQEIKLGLFHTSFEISSILFSLCFELSKLDKIEKYDLDLVDTSLINQLLNLVQETRGDAQESFNYDVIRLLLVFNEQYMMSGQSENLVLDVLSQRIGTSDIFSANLIFMLNRSNDTCIQILILKLLYAIFTRINLYEYFYTNDLYVLVDIILREVCGLGDTKEAQTLLEAYLRVLEPLLENTQLNSRPYKKNEIYRVLQQLIHPGMRRKVHSTTKRLVKRIIENWWEKLMDCNSPYTSSLGPSTPSDDIPETELTKQIV